jgi:anti-sigma regulatory factor (Ser/Thr protein kinase)
MKFEHIENREGAEIYEEEFSWENEPGKSDEAQTLADEKLKALGWPEGQAFAFSEAVHEAVDNAIVHGNLNVNRKDGSDDYPDRIKAAQEANKEKRVRMYFRFSKDDATAQIKDEGGYVPEKLDDPTAGEHVLDGSGRGLYLIFSKVDDVNFAPGEIIIHKQRKDNEDAP